MLFEQALVTSKACLHKTGEANVLNSLGILRNMQCRFAEALEFQEQALEIFEKEGDAGGIAKTLLNISNIYGATGDLAMDMYYLERALKIQEEIGDQRGAAITLSNIGIVHASQEDYSRAREYHQRSLTISEAIGDRGGVGLALFNIGIVNCATGNMRQGITCLEEVLQIYRSLGKKHSVAHVLERTGVVHFNMHAYEQALECYRESLELFLELGDAEGIAMVTGGLGILHSTKEYVGYDAAQAEKQLLQAENLAAEIGARDVQMEYCAALAELHKSQLNWELFGEYTLKANAIEKEMNTNAARKAAEQFELRNVIAAKDREKEVQKQELEYELKRQQEILTNKTLQMVQQTEMMERIRSNIEGILRKADSAEYAIKEVKKSLKSLPENILNWKRFEADVIAVHPHFQHTIKERYPSLTEMEIKVCCMLRIGMKSHEIATLLFVTERTVENHRYHIKKKIATGNARNIVDVLFEI